MLWLDRGEAWLHLGLSGRCRHLGAQRKVDQGVFINLAVECAYLIVVDIDLTMLDDWVLSGLTAHFAGSHTHVLMLQFAEKSRHTLVINWFIFLVKHVLLEFLVALLFPSAESESKELIGTSLFCCLLYQNVLKQVLISLYQSLRVNLPVFNLLFSIALDSLHQSLHRLCLLVFQLVHLSFHCNLQLLLSSLSFQNFLLLDHKPHGLCLVIVLDGEVYLFLFAHSH